MANRTDTLARAIHGTNPQRLLNAPVMERVYDTVYWKKDCFGLNAALLVDRAVDLKYIAGTMGEYQKPSKFLCLTLKLLQIQPPKEIIIEYIRNDTFKYLRLLGAFYIRLTSRSKDIYQYLEPLLSDHRKVVFRDANGNAVITHIDEIIHQMLHSSKFLNLALPHLTRRELLENQGMLESYQSPLDTIVKQYEDQTSDEESEESDSYSRENSKRGRSRSRSPSYRKSRRSYSRSSSRSRTPSSDRTRKSSSRRYRSYSRSPSREPRRSKYSSSRSRSNTPPRRSRSPHSRSPSRERKNKGD